MNNRLYFIKDNYNNMVFDIDSSKFFKINKNKEALLKDERFINMLSNLKKMKKMPPKKNKRLNKVTVVVTSNCNLRCKYCFATYIERQTPNNMSFEICTNVFDKLLNEYPKGIDQIMFFGGEPLIAFEEIKKLIIYYDKKVKELDLKPARYGLVTNGTIFNDEIIKFFNEFKDKINVTISIDGTKEINDLCRVDNQEKGVYERIIDNIKKYKENIKFRTSIEVTINKNHLIQYEKGKAREWMKELLDLGLYGITAGVVESQDEKLGLGEGDEEKYRMMYGEIIDYFFEELINGRKFVPADIIEGLKVLKHGEYVPLSCTAGLNNLTIDVKGNILPCYTFSDREDYIMVYAEKPFDIKFNTIQKEFADQYYKKPEECNECWIRNICNIWCRGLNNQSNKDPLTILKPRCWTGQVLYERIIVNLVKLNNDKEKYKRFTQTIKKLSKY